MNPLVLLGGGGHCKSVIDAALSAGLQINGILDPSLNPGSRILGFPVLGPDSIIPDLAPFNDFVITVGFIENPAIRLKLQQAVETAGGHFATVIASTARVSQFASVGEGSVILHHASVNADASIAPHAIINTAANIDHEASVGIHSHVSTGAMVNGNCRIGNRSFIGSASVIANGISVGDDVILGAGSAVFKNITLPGTYLGFNARKIK